MAKTRLLRGECYCRKTGYEVADEFRYAANCHCRDCRRTTGSAFKSFARIRRDLLREPPLADLLLIGQEPNFHATCRHCGSLLYSIVNDGAHAHVAMGTLVDEPSIRPSEHIFVGSKADWFTITDGLPQHRRFPGEEQAITPPAPPARRDHRPA